MSEARQFSPFESKAETRPPYICYMEDCERIVEFELAGPLLCNYHMGLDFEGDDMHPIKPMPKEPAMPKATKEERRLMARIAELEKQVEAARAEGYQKGVEDAANFIQTNPHYFDFDNFGSEEVLAEDMRAMLLGVKPLDPADLPTMMSLWGILKDDDYSEEKETDYNPVPPKATYTAMARFKLVGRGKPLDQ